MSTLTMILLATALGGALSALLAGLIVAHEAAADVDLRERLPNGQRSVHHITLDRKGAHLSVKHAGQIPRAALSGQSLGAHAGHRQRPDRRALGRRVDDAVGIRGA
jgi:hypothetical protein